MRLFLFPSNECCCGGATSGNTSTRREGGGGGGGGGWGGGGEGLVVALTSLCCFSCAVAPFQGSPAAPMSLWNQGISHMCPVFREPLQLSITGSLGAHLHDQEQPCTSGSAIYNYESVAARIPHAQRTYVPRCDPSV